MQQYLGTAPLTLSRSRLPTPIPGPNVIPLCTTTLPVPNAIIIISIILVTAPNIVITALLLRSYLGNGTKCVSS